MDSRTSSILINLDLKNLNSKLIANQYINSKSDIEEAEKDKDRVKSYRSLKQTVKECYFVGSLKYGNNFVM